MKILFLGDVVGRSGRDAVVENLPKLRQQHALDAIIVNVDNAAGGFGVTPQIAKEILAAGADALTGGDHIWDQKDIVPYLAQEKRLLRPYNMPASCPGFGAGVFETKNGKRFALLHLLGQVFHKEHAACPFASADEFLKSHKLGGELSAIFVDFHAEATSEKMAMGHYLAGRVSAVVGSHTHVPTADVRIIQGGTAYQTDAGMCGDYDSVIGFDKEAPLQRFLTKMTKIKLEAANGKGTLRGLLVETDASGKATSADAFTL